MADRPPPSVFAPGDLARRLRAMPRAGLDALFAGAEAGPIPAGSVRGMLILPLAPVALRGAGALAGALAWRGKRFDAAAGRVINLVLPLGLPAVTAEVRLAPSRLDGRPCILLDYAGTSVVARGVQDELRRIAPGAWLGRAHWHGVRVADFLLQAG